jgi:hypothetical protein
MTDRTEHNAQVVAYGSVATAADAAVEVVFPEFTAIEGALVGLNGTDNVVAIKVAISGITLTITPVSTVGDTAALYDIIAWGY